MADKLGGKNVFEITPAGVSVGHQRTVWQNDTHQVNAGVFAAKPFTPAPPTVGGNVQYQHLPTGSGIDVGIQNTPKYGTDVSASGNLNVWNNENAKLQATASVTQHMGGPFGKSKPQYGAGLRFEHKF